MTTKWNKYTYLNTDTDSLVEVTQLETSKEMINTILSESPYVILSLVDATIQPNLTKEEKMETPFEATMKPIFPTEYIDAKIVEQADRIKSLEYSKDNLNASVNKYYSKEQQLRTYLTDNYDDLEHHAQEIADIFDITLTKETTYTVSITASVTVDVPLEELDSVEEFIHSNLTVSSYDSQIDVNHFDIDSVNESY